MFKKRAFKQKQERKAVKWAYSRYPEGTEKIIIDAVHTYLSRRKMILPGILFLISILAGISFNFLPDKLAALGIDCSKTETILQGIVGFSSIISVCLFAKSTHDPLTYLEQLELAIKDSREKTGVVSEELQNEYDEAKKELLNREYSKK